MVFLSILLSHFSLAFGCFARQFLLIPESKVLPISSRIVSSKFPTVYDPPVSNGNDSLMHGDSSHKSDKETEVSNGDQSLPHAEKTIENREDVHWFIAEDYKGR